MIIDFKTGKPIPATPARTRIDVISTPDDPGKVLIEAWVLRDQLPALAESIDAQIIEVAL